MNGFETTLVQESACTKKTLSLTVTSISRLGIGNLQRGGPRPLLVVVATVPISKRATMEGVLCGPTL